MFQPQHVSALLRERLRAAATAARQMTNAGPVLTVAELLGQFGLAQVELRVSEAAIVGERQYAAQVPDRFVAGRTVTAQRKDYDVTVPFDGDPEIVRALLGTCTHTPQWTVGDTELRARFTVDPQTPGQQVKAQIDTRTADAAQHIAHGHADLAKYRDDLIQVVTSVITQVQAAHGAGQQQRNAIGLPVRITPPTAPSVQPQPAAAPASGAADPLDILFERVLAETRRIGHELESFTGLTNRLSREEHNRDVVIAFLRLSIPECEFTPETLHGQGKNDIHVRHKGQVVCVIEFKAWGTEQEFKDAVDQLLSYLTVRDSRGAVVLLIRNQGVLPVIEKTKQWLLEHDNCNDQDMPDGQWRSDFSYHATGDPDLPIKMIYLPFAFTTSATGASTTRGLPGGVTR